MVWSLLSILHGLNDAKTRKALDPQVREAYLDLLKTASVDNVDRGDTKSARIVLEVTPSLLRTLGDAGASGHLAPQKENGEQPPDRNVGKPNVGKKPRKNQSPAAPPRM